MFSVRRVLLTCALGTALGAGPAVAAPAMADPWDNNRDRGRAVNLSAMLSARGVVAEDRDLNGWGTVQLKVRPGMGQVCFTYWVRGVEDPENINVYAGGRNDRNRDDDIRIELRDSGSYGTGCRQISPRLARAMAERPGRYNAQVDGEDGAIRGQLRSNDRNRDW